MDAEAVKTEFYKSRSLVGRLSSAFKFINDNFKYLFKKSCWILLPLALFESLYFVLFGFTASFTVGHLAAAFLVLLAAIAGSLLFSSFIYTSLRSYIDLGYVPAFKLKKIRQVLFRNAIKLLKLYLVMLIPVLLLIIVCVSAFLLTPLALFVTIPLLVFILIPAVYSIFYYMLEDAGLLASIKKSYRLGLPNWGSTFVVLFLMTVLTVILQMIASLPFLIALFVDGFAKTSFLQGNEAILPGFFVVLLFVLSFIGTFISAFSSVLFPIAVAFQFGSIEASRLEQEVSKFD